MSSFANIDQVNLFKINMVLNQHQLRMKQVCHVPFEHNVDRVKGWYQHPFSSVPRSSCMETFCLMWLFYHFSKCLNLNLMPGLFSVNRTMDKAGFNPQKTRWQGRNIAGNHDNVVGQLGGNDACAAIVKRIHRHAQSGAFYTPFVNIP